MISNRSPQRIFYTLTLSAITALLLTSCGGSSSSDSTIETAAVAEISGTLKEADGTVINAATVDLDDLKAKVLDDLRTTTDTDGKYTVKPTAIGDYQLVFTKEGYAKQYKPVSVTSSGASITPTVMSKVDKEETIDNTTGGSITAPIDSTNPTGSSVEIAIPANAADQSIVVSLTLLTGVEIPSTLPTVTGKTLLPVGALSMSILPDTITTLSSAATASVPVPTVLQDEGRTFTVHVLTNGVWTDHSAGIVSDGKDTVTFKITTAGTYMVMTEIADITADSSSTSSFVDQTAVTVTPGNTLEEPVTNTITITGLDTVTDAAAKAEIEALIKSLLEQQNGTQFGVAQTNTTEVSNVATKQSSAKLAAKLVCTSTSRTTTTIIVFTLDLTTLGFGIINIPVTIVITTTIISCSDDGTGLGTGGTGSTG